MRKTMYAIYKAKNLARWPALLIHTADGTAALPIRLRVDVCLHYSPPHQFGRIQAGAGERTIGPFK